MEKIILSKDIKNILNILNKYGKGYVVGGFVRDSLLGFKAKDCDFCTNIDYEKLKIIFKNYSPIEIGKSFGIIQIKYNKKKYEIAKFRQELSFTEKRNNVKIKFIDAIEEDLKRRDFTLNAVVYDGENLFSFSNQWKYDLQNKILRFIGDTKKRIEEDPLRLLRCIRIASEKDLIILDRDKNEISKMKTELTNISVERIREEFFKMLENKNRIKSISLLEETEIFKFLFSETYEKNNFNILKNKISLLKKLKIKKENILEIILIIIFFHSVEELNFLKINNQMKKNIKLIINNFGKLKSIENKYELKKIISVINFNNLEKAIILLKLDESFDKMKIKKINSFLKEIKKNSEPIYLKDLKINGNDILNVGIVEGEKIAEILKNILDLILKNPEINDRKYLLENLKTIIKD